MTGTEDRSKRSRAHLFAGIAALVVAVIATLAFGWLAGLAMALVGVGNLLATRELRRDGEVAPSARALIVVGGLGFAVICVLLAIRALHG